jgi:type II secretory pathway pseudopilin PulG
VISRDENENFAEALDMSIHSRRRRAFSLVELLVILAVMMIAVSLTLPAILRARQAAREESCRNNLKQLGLALHNYHDVYGVFAPAWCARFSEADSPAWMGWQAALLPFVEQAALYNLMYQDKNAPEWPAGGKIERTAISVYQCPMDSTGGVNPFRGGFGTSNYSGNFGPELLPRWFESSAEEFWPGAVASPQNSTGSFAITAAQEFVRFWTAPRIL